MHKKVLAAVATAALSLALVTIGTAPAVANNETCDSIGFPEANKTNGATGSDTITSGASTVGTLSWNGTSLSHTINAGWSVELCIKSGSQAGTTTYVLTSTSTPNPITISQDISHVSWRNPTTTSITPQYSVQGQYCEPPLASGSISVTLDSRISFSLKDASNNPISLASGTAAGLAPGTYYLSATDADTGDGFAVNGFTDTPVTVTAYQGECGGTDPEPLTPQYSHEDQKCVEEEYVGGSISVTLNPAITFSLKDSSNNAIDISSGTASGLAPGTYYLSAADADANDDYLVQEFTDTPIVIDEYGDECGGTDPEPLTPQYSHEDQKCVEEEYVGGSISVTLNPAITFSLKDSSNNPVDISSGTASGLAPGTYYLSAADADANDDYLVQEFTDTPIVIDEYGFICGDLTTNPTVEASVSSTPLTCSANGSFTLSDNAVTSEEFPGPAVFWTVNGSPSSAGTFSVTAPGTVVIQVSANGPTWGFTEGQQTEWEIVFTGADACGDLETLALTGADDAAPGLALAAFLGLLGAALVRSGARLGRQQV